MAPLPDYHWCPGQFWDPGWGSNWDWGRCHDDGYFDGEPRDGATGTVRAPGATIAAARVAGTTAVALAG